MKVVMVGNRSFNADAFEGMSLDKLREQYPDMRKDVFNDLAGKLGIKKAAKPKKVKESED